MWLFELFGLTVVAGVVGGLVWRAVENWAEQKAFRQSLEESESGEEVVGTVAGSTRLVVNQSTDKLN